MTNLTKELNEVDKVLSAEFQKLSQVIAELQFEEIGVFTLSFDTPEIFSDVHNCPGIYLFEIEVDDFGAPVTDWLSNFKALWEHPDYHRKFVPGLKQIRASAHIKLQQWMPLYIGKSHNVSKRINEHIIKEIGKTTFAMKLKARLNLHGSRFRISYIPVKVVNYNAIIPFIEYELRNKHNPIIGKQ